MIHLIYVSYAPAPLSVSELDSLLEVSRRNNLRDGITGMLLYHDGDFMQVLEGEEDAVRETYRRILDDPRNGGNIVLEEAPISHRDFGEWSMGFKRIENAALPAGFVDFFSRPFDVGALVDQGSEAMQFLLSFKENGR